MSEFVVSYSPQQVAVSIDPPVIERIEPVPPYEGNYSVSPSLVPQTLLTSGKKMLNDVTVSPLVPYSGSYSVTPSLEAQTLLTSGRYMTGNVTVSPVIPFEGSYSVTPAIVEQVLPTSGKQMLDNVTVSAIPTGYVFDLLANCTNKGYRTLTGTISGNGTDPNWQWGEPVEIHGQTRIECYMQGYSTVASIMFFDEGMGIISYQSGSTIRQDALAIPSNAAFVAVSIRVRSANPGQFCHMT